MPTQSKDWQAPTFEIPDSKKLGWVKEAIEDGTTWVKKNCSDLDISRGIDILSGQGGDKTSLRWSNIHTGDLSRDIREIIETLANVRLSFSGYQTGNAAFKAHADMMNKVTQIIYLKYFVDRSLRDALQFAALTGAGFISPYYNRSMYGTGKGQFVFEALGQPDVLPVQLPKDRNYQEAYAVTISRFMPIARAHAMFPLYQSKIQPFAKQKYSKSDRIEARRTSNRWRMHSMDTIIEQYAEIFYTYILDLRINDCERDAANKIILKNGKCVGTTLPMGQPDTSWFYEVPYLGSDVQRWKNGSLQTVSATDEDCRVYPQRRLMISCDQALMYDGPAFDWHGMVPLVPFYLNDWAWEGTGYSLFAQTASLQESIDQLERSCNRIAMARANPGKAVNLDSMSKDSRLSSRQAEALDPFDPNGYFPMDGDISEPPMRPPMPEWCYNIPDWVPASIERLRESIHRTLGLDQIQSLQKLRANIQNPEQLLDAEGPVVIGTSRSMEQGLRLLGEMTKYNVLQYMPTGVIVEMVGADKIPASVFDYEPDSLIPSHLAGETTIDADGKNVPSAFGRDTRARVFADNLEYVVVPHSLHEIAQNHERLNLLALMGRGPEIFPVDPETLGNKFNIDWGQLEGSTIQEKSLSWAKMQVEAKAELQKLANELMPPPPPQEEGQPATGGPSNGGAGAPVLPPPKAPVGRPSTFKSNPQAEQKGLASGGRVVLNTSR